ncbi:SGNH/GDSL hydrolase family protein [Nonomuraea sp. NPDC050328]|uniref:SGNH/GDSL hydrolase family protein n=1 Tax=Nonomuraea sp. NPDC050328 TaxID=3364361 RepID=UPI0037B23C2A
MNVLWLFCGDSVTQGALHTFGFRDYTQLFAERVRFELERPGDVVVNTAVSGARFTQPDLARFEPDVVSLMFGMNDCLDGTRGLDGFHAAYAEAVTRIQRAGARAVVHTPNRVLPGALPERIEHLGAYAEVARKVAADTGALLVDHHAEWGGRPIAHWMADDCHPNEYGHRALARSLLRALDLWDPASGTGRLFIP